MMIDPKNIPPADWLAMVKQLCEVRGQMFHEDDVSSIEKELKRFAECMAVLNSYAEIEFYRKRSAAIGSLSAKPWYMRWFA